MRESPSEHPSEMLTVLARGLAADPAALGAKAVEVLRGRSPELVRWSGADPVATSAGFMEILVGSLRSDVDMPWKESVRISRQYGRERASQGVPLETLIGELAVYRRATLELITAPIQDGPGRDEVVAYAQSHLEDVVERLTAAIAIGYLDRVKAMNLASRTALGKDQSPAASSRWRRTLSSVRETLRRIVGAGGATVVGATQGARRKRVIIRMLSAIHGVGAGIVTLGGKTRRVVARNAKTSRDQKKQRRRAARSRTRD
jgi:hypothetical protein